MKMEKKNFYLFFIFTSVYISAKTYRTLNALSSATAKMRGKILFLLD
jgi:hypothetical protein